MAFRPRVPARRTLVRGGDGLRSHAAAAKINWGICRSFLEKDPPLLRLTLSPRADVLVAPPRSLPDDQEPTPNERSRKWVIRPTSHMGICPASAVVLLGSGPHSSAAQDAPSERLAVLPGKKLVERVMPGSVLGDRVSPGKLKGRMSMDRNEGTVDALSALSDGMADAVEKISPAGVRVNGCRRRSGRGEVYAPEMVLTASHVLECE